jgi:hypothetical protein
MTAETVARGAAAVLMLLGTAAICVLLQVVSGQTNAGTTALASFAGLLWAQSVARSRDDGARILLAFAALLATFLLLGVPMPPVTTEAWLSATILVAAIVMSCLASILATRHRPVARALVALLSLYGVVVLVAAVRLTAGQTRQDGPAVTLSRSFAIMLAASWLIASWSLTPPRTRRPTDSVAAAT